MAGDGMGIGSNQESRGRRKILILDDKGNFPEDFMEYAVHLAARLNHDLLVLSADTAWEGEGFRKRAEETVKTLRTKAETNGIGCESMIKRGDLGWIMADIKVTEKRIGFVLASADMDRRKIAEYLPLPIFSILSKKKHKGGNLMADKTTKRKRQLAIKTAGFGVVTALLYAAVFINADVVMKFFTRGGWYAAMPVVTVFAFSFAHGTFAGNLWSLLGIEAVQKDALREVERKAVQKKQKVAKKPRTYAYVNPFHRL
ncbi:MAG: hypothetical protein ACOZF0_22540 [Thermodesulfobacteriota bacterium]